MSAIRQLDVRLKILWLIIGIALGFTFSRILVTERNRSDLKIVRQQEARTELNRYYPKHYSRGNEEMIIRHFLKDRQDGFFVDVGAYHYKDESNTYYLEKRLGWRGIAIDANPAFERDYRKYRKNTKFINSFVSDKSDEDAIFYIVKNQGQVVKSSGVQSFVSGLKTEQVHVSTITLNKLLSSLGVEHIDFLSMDIELWEPKALAGFDIDKYHPELVCIEAHRQVRNPILSYFKSHGYVRLDQYFLFDQKNWYFVPETRFAQIFDVDY